MFMSLRTRRWASAGFTFADLHQPARLRELYDRFVEQVKADRARAVGAVGAVSRGARIAERRRPRQHRRRDGAARQPLRRALFGVGAEVEALVAATRAYDVLFRFKIDFVRRRALPLLKAGAHVEATAEDHALAERSDVRSATARAVDSDDHDAEMRLAAYGCSLLDREAADKARRQGSTRRPSPEIESLKRWCAAHLHDPRYRGWVVFRFPENLDYDHLVQVQRPDPKLPEEMVGPDEKLRRREGLQAHRQPLHAPRES